MRSWASTRESRRIRTRPTSHSTRDAHSAAVKPCGQAAATTEANRKKHMFGAQAGTPSKAYSTSLAVGRAGVSLGQQPPTAKPIGLPAPRFVVYEPALLERPSDSPRDGLLCELQTSRQLSLIDVPFQQPDRLNGFPDRSRDALLCSRLEALHEQVASYFVVVES